MKFGYFDDRNKEYVITTPQTPLPWINYLGSEDFFSLVSNTAGGYSFYRDARMRRLTRYRYNNSPLDMDGHRIYIKDGDTVWNPGWQPTKTPLDSYSCRHGLGYTIAGGQKGRCDRPAGVVRPQGRRLRAGPGDGVQRKRRRQGAGPVQLCGVLPVGRRGRQLQLPAQLLHWRGGGGRQRHLPQDRVPRTPQPLRRFLGKLPGGQL